jgi:hypothetical protein
VVERVLRWECESWEAFPPGTIGLVVHAPAPLVLHHIPLGVEFLLGHGREELPHPVCLEPERDGELVGRDGLEVVGAFEPGGPVQGAASALDELEVLIRSDLGRSLEEHVLEEVRKARASHPFVGRSHVVPEVHRDDRRRMVLGERNEESIGEPEGVDRYAHGRKLCVVMG